MQLNLEMEYWQDGDWLVGRLRGVPGVFSQGRTVEELEANIQEVFQLMQDTENPPSQNIKTKAVTVTA